MGLFNNLQGSRGAMRLFIIQLVCCLAWLSTFAFAQFDISEGITGSINFPAQGVTCVANLAVLVTSLIRGRLDLEIGARDVLDFIASPKLKNIKGINDGNGLITVKEEQTASTGGGSESATNSKSQTEERLDLEIGAQDVPDFIASTKLKNIEGINDGNGLITVKEDEDVQTDSTGGGSESPTTSASYVLNQATFNAIAERLPAVGLHTLGMHSMFRGVPYKKPNLESADGVSYLESADVVMLSNGTQNWSMRQFMKSNAPIVDSILLQYISITQLGLTLDVGIGWCVCKAPGACKCIVFWTVQEITIMVARRLPRTLKQLSDSLCLLPCLSCLKNGCHGCKQGLLYVDSGRLTRVSPDVESPAVVCQILDDISERFGSIRPGEPICICIPMHDASYDVWTELLLRSLRSKDAENRGVRVMASEALEGYLAGRRRDKGEEGTVEYDIVSFIVPRLTEVLINLALTFWFRVDGFSSALLARRTIRDYLVDSKGNGLAANAFLSKALVKSNASNTQVCQVLTFRGNVIGIRGLSFIVGCVNLISAIGWALLIAMEDRADTSPPLSMPIVLIIIGTIGIVLGMDVAPLLALSDIDYMGFTDLAILILSPIPLLILLPFLLLLWRFNVRLFTEFMGTYEILFLSLLGLEIVFIVSGSAVAGILGIKGFGRWIYGIVQILVWLKWAAGSYILDKDMSQEFMGKNTHTREIFSRVVGSKWEILIYASAFLLNAVLAGVRCKWEPWPWKKHHIKPVS